MINDAQNLNVSSNMYTLNVGFEKVVNKIKTQETQSNQIKEVSDNYIAVNNNLKINSLIQVNNIVQTNMNIMSVANGSLESMSSMFEHIRDLSVQASSGVYSKEIISDMQTKVNELNKNIHEVINSTKFAGITPFKDDEIKLQTGIFKGEKTFETLNLKIDLKENSFDITTGEKLNQTIDEINYQINSLDILKTDIQHVSKILQNTIATNNVAIANISSTSSNIQDIDIAKASSEIIKETIIKQAKKSLFAQTSTLETEKLIGLTKKQ